MSSLWCSYITVYWQMFSHSVHLTVHFLWRKSQWCIKSNAPGDSCYDYPSCVCVIKDLGQLLGTLSGVSQAAPYSACQYITPCWLSKAQKTSAPAIGFLSPHPPSPQNEDFFYLKRPCPQQDSNSVIREHAKLCRLKQMKVGTHCRVHSGVVSSGGKVEGEGMESFLSCK